jgi:hypothetical protein
MLTNLGALYQCEADITCEAVQLSTDHLNM